MLGYLTRRAPAGSLHLLGDLGAGVRHHPVAARRFRRRLHLESLGLGQRHLRRSGGAAPRRVRARPADVRPVRALDAADAARRPGHGDGVAAAGHRGHRRPALADDGRLARRGPADLGRRLADRHLLRRAAVLAGWTTSSRSSASSGWPSPASCSVCSCSTSASSTSTPTSAVCSRPSTPTRPGAWAKVVDLLKHLPIPAVILGIASMAQAIRIMRANLLDELRKPYVVTARAKGLSEWQAILQYPVRVALNPFASTIGYTLPYVVSGSIIVSLVLGLADRRSAAAAGLDRPGHVPGGGDRLAARDHDRDRHADLRPAVDLDRPADSGGELIVAEPALGPRSERP